MAKKKNVFEEMMEAAKAQHNHAEKERRELQEAMQKKEKEKEARGRELVRLQRIAYLAGYDYNPLDWNLREPGNNWNDYEWKKLWELDTSTLSFCVSLAEAKNLKKFKYVVEVRAWETTLSGKPGEIHGGYRHTDYGKDKYMKRINYGNWEVIKGQELEKKFANLKDAEDFATEWMGRLYNDHLEAIAADREVYDSVKAAGLTYDPYARTERGGSGAIVTMAERDARRNG